MVTNFDRLRFRKMYECPYCREYHENSSIEYKGKFFCNKNHLNAYKKAEKFISKYRDEPINFIEDFMGVELKWYQKVFLKKLYTSKDVYTNITTTFGGKN